jgi:hypothetical protein
MAVSQNGWPVYTSMTDDRMHLWVVPGTERKFRLRFGSAGFLLCHFILWYHQHVHALNEKGSVWDEWAWAFRPVRGGSSLSNHASGTAVDLNATKYPLGTTLMAAWRKVKIRARLVFFLGTIRWGGDYEGRKDEMHFEINRSLSICEKLARQLTRTPRGKKILEANPGQREIIFS